MDITATLVNIYYVCQREAWLHANGITMEHNSDVVTEGRLIGEYSYAQRSERYKELALDGIKIDFFDAENKVVHEIKKSASMEGAHVAQVKYYLWVLEQNGIVGATGVIEYPKLRQKVEVLLTEVDRAEFPVVVEAIGKLIALPEPPSVIRVSHCKGCSYFDYCFIEEPLF